MSNTISSHNDNFLLKMIIFNSKMTWFVKIFRNKLTNTFIIQLNQNNLKVNKRNKYLKINRNKTVGQKLPFGIIKPPSDQNPGNAPGQAIF